MSLWGAILGGVGGIIVLLSTFLYGQKVGKESERLKTSSQTIDNLSKAKKIKEISDEELLKTKGKRE